MYYVYLLHLSNNQIYTGYSENLTRRVYEHRAGAVLSTRHRRPIRLIHYEVYLLKEDALRRERFLKTSDGKRLLRQQLSTFFRNIGK